MSSHKKKLNLDPIPTNLYQTNTNPLTCTKQTYTYMLFELKDEKGLHFWKL